MSPSRALPALFCLAAGLVLGGCAARRALPPPMSAAERAGGAEDPRAEIGRLVQQLDATRDHAGLPSGDRGAAALSEGPAPAAAPEAGAPPEGAGRCGAACRAGADICRYAERICALAADLADDDSRRSCERARGDCAAATRVCKSCR